jgi:signal transduction histidine kinase
MRLTASQLADIALAAALAFVGVAGTVAVGHNADLDRSVELPGLALVTATALVLAVRRRWPVGTYAVAAVLTSVYLILGYPYGPILLSFFVAGYTLARYLPLPVSAPASLAALLLLLSHLITHPTALPGLVGLVPASAWVVVPFAVGVTVRITRESVARERADAVRQRVNDERLRVAQEVHDVVGHGLAAIKMQADIALHLLARKPEQAETALHAISRTSTEALDELRATLAVVRRPDSDTDPTRSPPPGLGRLDDLCHRMSTAGVQVRMDTTGSPRDLPAAVDIAGYRVVQESLTNVLRHSAAKVASVRIGYETDAVVISVANPVASVPSGRAGLGIAGMRERVASLGGDFTAGPSRDGQFEVLVRIPTGGRL